MQDLARQLRFASGLNSDPAWWHVLGLPASLARACIERPHPRTTGYLSRRLAQDLPLPEMACNTDVLRRFATFDKNVVADIILRSGAVWHASRLRWIIENQERAQLVEALGDDVFAFALNHAELCLVDGARLDSGILIDSIRQDGQRCWQYWLGRQPGPIRARLALLPPPRPQVQGTWDATRAAQGVLIVDRVITALRPTR